MPEEGGGGRTVARATPELGDRTQRLAELERHLSELPRRGEVAAYCRGPYCVLTAWPPSHSRCAMAWLTITTAGAPATSR